jgi:hypothetical protein
MEVDNFSFTELAELGEYCRQRISDERLRLLTVIKQKFTHGNMRISRNCSNRIDIDRISTAGLCTRIVVAICYYHQHKLHGGERDHDGDIRDTYPYYVDFNGDCTCKSYQVKCITIADVLVSIRDSQMIPEKRVDGSSTFDENVTTMLKAVEALEELPIRW